MNKAVPWNINGVGFDAREAAREAARRQGKSLGEWLHGVIADHAAEMGVEERDIAGQDRIEAVSAKLERLSARSASFDERMRRDESSEPPRPRLRRRDAELDAYDEAPRSRGPRRRPGGPLIEETEFLLEEAIDSMERRAFLSEKRTDSALTSFSKLLEANEAKRDREREAVVALTQKLSDIETRLSDRMSGDQSPIKGALARLEARLDTIGRRTAEEGAVRLGASAADTPADSAAEPMRRLESKLNSILDVVNGRSQGPDTSTLAIAASQQSLPHRRLGEAIAAISQRQRELDDPRPVGEEPRRSRLRPSAEALPRGRPDEALSGAFAAMRREITALATKVEDLRGDLTLRQETHAGRRVDFDDLRHEIGSMSESLRMLVSRGTGPVEEFDARRHEIAGAAPDRTPSGGPSQNQDGEPAIERLVRDLGHKIEAVQSQGSDPRAIDALQKQIELLSTRFDRSEQGLSGLSKLEGSIRDLFAHLESTRAGVERSAAAAAREALTNVLDGGKADTSASADMVALKAKQDEADARMRATLGAVHETLEKVVDRLATMEGDIAEVRSAAKKPPIEPTMTRVAVSKPDFAPASPARQLKPVALGAPDPLFEPILKPKRASAAANDQAKPAERDEENGRADFIAAARRAAQAAQSDPSLVAFRQAPSTTGAEGEVRAGLLAKSRDYVASHKRPVLMSIAALFMILGTVAILQRATETVTVAESAAPAKIARLAETPIPATPAADDALSPSALPKTANTTKEIPGSDPIQTASISNLPSFAAQNVGPSMPELPKVLMRRADAGDGAAEYELGTRYADGKGLMRDLKQAARLYQKAADQGIIPAQYRLASLYEKGLGVTQDKVKARSLYTQAAEAGNPRAMHNLAVLLADGDGKPDYEGAATWFRKAAHYGVHDSQFNLAILLARGLGVQQSLVQSYQWFAIAADQNDADAAKKRDEVGARLNAADLSIAKALATSFRAKVADSAATDVTPPPGGWDGAPTASPLNSAKSKVSSL